MHTRETMPKTQLEQLVRQTQKADGIITDGVAKATQFMFM